MSVATRGLTEAGLQQALVEAPAATTLHVGTRAKLRADRIVRSPGGPLQDAVQVVEERWRHADEWELT